MAISESIDDYLNEARGALRSALVIAARNERPSVIRNLSNVLDAIDYVKESEEREEIVDGFIGKMKDKFKNGGGYNIM